MRAPRMHPRKQMAKSLDMQFQAMDRGGGGGGTCGAQKKFMYDIWNTPELYEPQES